MPLCFLVKQLNTADFRGFRRLLYFVDVLVVSEKDTEYKIERARDWFQAFLILGNCSGHALQKGGIHSG